MGKSEGNMITLKDSPDNMYGKIMSWTDAMIIPAFEILTQTSLEVLDDMKDQLKLEKTNPRDLKMKLAHEIVSIYLGEKKADEAEENFKRVFQSGQNPEKIKETKINTDKLQDGKIGILDLFVLVGLAKTNSEMRRLIKEGAIKIDNKKINQDDLLIEISSESIILQRGKKGFMRVVAK